MNGARFGGTSSGAPTADEDLLKDMVSLVGREMISPAGAGTALDDGDTRSVSIQKK